MSSMEGQLESPDNGKGAVSLLTWRAMEGGRAGTAAPSHGVYQGLTEKANVSSKNWNNDLEGTCEVLGGRLRP